MSLIQLKSPRKVWIVALASLALVAGLVGLGYREGNFHRGGTAGPKLARLNAPPPTIPANATPEMKQFLQNQFTLTQKMEQLRGQGANGTLTPQAFAQFRQQNADLIKRQSELSQVIAQQQNKNIPTAPLLQIPPKASPQLQAYLTARDQLMRDQIAFMNQHATDSLEARQVAIQQWREQNETRFQQLQQLADALKPVKSTSAQ